VHGLGEVEVVDWTDHKLPGELLRLCDTADRLVVSSDRWRHRANIVRWWLLREHGGIWLDHDVVPLSRVDQLAERWTAAARNYRVTCALGFPKGDPLPIRMLARLDVFLEAMNPPMHSATVVGSRALDDLVDPGVEAINLLVDGHGDLVNARSPLLHLWAHHGL